MEMKIIFDVGIKRGVSLMRTFLAMLANMLIATGHAMREVANASGRVVCMQCGTTVNAPSDGETLNEISNGTNSQKIISMSVRQVIGSVGFCLAGIGAYMGWFGFPYPCNLIGLVFMVIGILVMWAADISVARGAVETASSR